MPRILGHWLVPLFKESAVEYFVDLTYMTCFVLSTTISHSGPGRKKNAVLEISPSFSHIKKLRELRNFFLRMPPI